jgi:hypothetical protein
MARYNPSLENQQGAAIVVTIVASAFCIKCMWDWYQEIKFYSGNNWDFSQDSGRYPGSFDKSDKRRLLSYVPKKTQIVFGYPFLIIICAVMAIAFGSQINVYKLY